MSNVKHVTITAFAGGAPAMLAAVLQDYELMPDATARLFETLANEWSSSHPAMTEAELGRELWAEDKDDLVAFCDEIIQRIALGVIISTEWGVAAGWILPPLDE